MQRESVDEVDLLVLDVEGHEMSVLDGMRGAPVLPRIACVEFGHIGFAVLRRAMRELGFEYDVHSNANAFFIRWDVLPLASFRAAAGPAGRASAAAAK